MASWFKVAEDIFEVVDRRAKLVVSELADEQSDSKSPASLGQESQARRAKLKDKVQLRRSPNEPPKTSDTEREETSIQVSADNDEPDTDKVSLSSENVGDMSSNPKTEISKELLVDLNEDGTIPSTSVLEAGPNDVIRHDSASITESPATLNDLEDVSSSMNGNITIENTLDGHEGSSSPTSVVREVEAADTDHPNDSDRPTDADQGQENKLGVQDVPLQIAPEGSELVNVETHSSDDSERNDPDQKEQPLLEPKKQQEQPLLEPKKQQEQPLLEPKKQQEQPLLEPKKQQEQRSDTSPIRVQDQLEEAQGLLKSAVSTGPSKEARLARVCAGLSSRLQEYKSENAQLEELLVAERERSNSYEARIKKLQQDLTTSKTEVSRVESNMGEALAAKNSEIETLTNSTNALKKQAAASEGKLASLQANMESIMRNRELTETRMMQALREELASAERRAEEERAAHNATKMSAMEREVELEHRALEASTALARIQRTVDERVSRAADLEQKLVLLEAECASLNQELQDMEVRARREQKRPPEEANQALQAWQEEVERARQGQRDAESKLSSMEAEVQKIRVEMAGMKRDAEHYSRQEHMELEKRYRELTDLLYYKQTQLETMASEKAAAEFQLEKEAKRLQEAQVEAERGRVSRRASSSWEEDTDLKALEPLPLHHRHMAGASLQLQKAAKLLDSGAVSATRFLWRYPVARIFLLFYLVFVHLFLMHLLHRLQEQADNFSANEVAASMGLAIPNLP